MIPLTIHTLFLSVIQCLDPNGKKKSSTADMTSLYELFTLLLYIVSSNYSYIIIIIIKKKYSKCRLCDGRNEMVNHISKSAQLAGAAEHTNCISAEE